MKIICICNNYPEQNKSCESALYKERPVILTKSDTTLLRDGRPFFVPDEAVPCEMQAELVVRICRLGRHISERFAARYYDAATVGVSFVARNMLEQLRSEGLPWDAAVGFDGSSALGRMLSLSPEAIRQTRFSIAVDGVEAQSGTAAGMAFGIDRIIAHVSRFYTLRQGDLIYCGAPCPPTTVRLDTHITGFLGEERVLDFNIK